MNYALDVLTNEISRLEKKLEDERGALKASLEYVERHQLTINRYEDTIEQLKEALYAIQEEDDE